MSSVTISFDEWLDWAFDHPISDPAWYWDDNAEELESEPAQVVAYLTKVFENPTKVLAKFTDEQINQGLWFIADNSCSDHMYAVTDEEVPMEYRIRCVRSIYS